MIKKSKLTLFLISITFGCYIQNTLAADYGDVPSPYLVNHLNDDARHTISDTYLGSLIDEEEDNATYQHYSEQAANKDDLNNLDDEDGIIGIDSSPLLSAATNEHQKTVNITVIASRSCRLSAWIDWNIDNMWSNSEKVLSDRVLQAGSNTVPIPIPTGEDNSPGDHNIVADSRDAGDKQSYARFRCTTGSNVDYWGLANDGEVEDYTVEIHTLGLIKGQIYEDVNFNTTFDAGDRGLSPVEVELLDPNDQVLNTITTDSNGIYEFEDVQMNNGTTGNYKVRVKPNQEGVLSNLCTLNDLITVKDANISGLHRVAKQDFGYVPYGEIGEYTWVDSNENQIKDANEKPLSGVRIILNLGSSTKETVTDDNGYYEFLNLPPKNYSVKADDASIQTGYSRTTTDGYSVNIVPNIETAIETSPNSYQYEGRIMRNANFGYKPTGTIGDYVWNDENADKNQDFFEKGIAGVTLHLFDNSNNEIGSTTTNSNGGYLFSDLEPKTYFVEVDENSNSLNGLQKSNTTTNRIEVSFGENSSTYLDADFGFYGNASIGNYIWKDLNENKEQDTSEPGIPDVTLSLHVDSNKNEQIDGDEPALVNTTTDINGLYSFTNLEPNSYIVKVTDVNDKLSSYVQTTSSDRINAPLHAVIDLQSGINYTDANFGYKPPLGSIGDCVWNDENMNQIKDNNEEGFKNIWIKLTQSNGTVQQTQTNQDCTYLFEDLLASSYTVEVAKEPTGFTYTTDKSYKITLGESKNDLNADFGFYKSLNTVTPPTIAPPTVAPEAPKVTPPPQEIITFRPPSKHEKGHYDIGDCVWDDQNKNGKRDNNEEGLSNVWLKLTGNSGTENINLQTKTNDDCSYLFKNVPEGQYNIAVIAPPYNYEATTPETKNIKLNGKDYYEADFGYTNPEIIRSAAPLPVVNNITLSTEIPQTGYNPERAAEGFSANSIFPEINIKNPYYEYVLFLYVEELLSKDNISLEETISLKDGLAMLVKGFEITEDTLSDMELEEILKTYGILTDETKFILHGHSLNSPITYERTLLLIARLAGLVNDENKVIKGHWQQNYYHILNERNLIPKNFKNNTNWQQVLTRGDFFSFVYRTIQRKQSETKSYVNKFGISMPEQNINNVPTRRTLLSHPDVWVEKLKNGAAFFEDRENDRLIVFAHSSNFPGETNPIIRFFGKIFNSLIGNVSKNDLINITVNNYKINYRVTEVQKVAGHEIEALEKKDENDLIVFTCDKDPNYRWIIRAKKSRH